MASIARTSSNTAARIDASFAAAGVIRAGMRVSILVPGLRKYLGIGAANVVGFQFVGANGLAALQVLPAYAGDDSAVGIVDLLTVEPFNAKNFKECNVRRDDRHCFRFGEKLFERQQTFAVLEQYGIEVAIGPLIASTLVVSRVFVNALVVAGVDFVAAGIERGQYSAWSRA